jgi:hypothetical protein
LSPSSPKLGDPRAVGHELKAALLVESQQSDDDVGERDDGRRRGERPRPAARQEGADERADHRQEHDQREVHRHDDTSRK